MYVFSDSIYFLIYFVIGYRKNVVKANLKNSFPGKNDAEIRLLTKQFYHHLCDISLESFKGFTMSNNEIVQRHRILNPELADHYFKKGASSIALPAHYNNWEWGSLSPAMQIEYSIVCFYKPMSNKLVDAFVKRHRAKFKTSLASIRKTAMTFGEFSGKPCAFIMAADQSPSNLEESLWFNFLNQDTAWLHGPEKYARKYNTPVLFIDIQKVRRGFYELELVVLTDNPASLPYGEITRLYARHLEQAIVKEPAYWLWSHKRWKHKRNKV